MLPPLNQIAKIRRHSLAPELRIDLDDIGWRASDWARAARTGRPRLPLAGPLEPLPGPAIALPVLWEWGIMVSYETVRRWVDHFEPSCSSRQPGSDW